MEGLDLVILVAYFALSLAIGLWFGRGERNTHDFFLGGRRQHWLLAGVSIIATEVSALTIVGVPADSFRGNWNYLQMYAGSFLGRMLIVLLLLPAFYGSSVTTVYEYLGHRFGPWTRTTASLMFFVSRIFGSGVRLLAGSLAVSEVFGWNLHAVIIGGTLIAMVYTAFGGIKAILWTDLFQAFIFMGAAGAVLVFLFVNTPGNWMETLDAARAAGKLHVFTHDAHPNNDRAFWVLMIHATFLNMAALGTDQDLTQRMLTCPDLRRGQRSLIFNAFAGFPIVCTFLLIGTMLHMYYHTGAGQSVPGYVQQHTDLVFPYFMATALPAGVGLRGLLVSAVFAASMSSLASSLGALSSTAVTDLYRPLRGTRVSEAHYLLVARVCTVFFGVLLVAVAMAFAGQDQLLWLVFKLIGIFFGGMLGVFLLGVLTRARGHDGLNAVIMLTSVAGLVHLMLLQERDGVVYVAWPWWVVIGSLFTLGTASMFGTRPRPVNWRST